MYNSHTENNSRFINRLLIIESSNLELMPSDIVKTQHVHSHGQWHVSLKPNDSANLLMGQTLAETYDCTYFLKGMNGEI